jgi:hypothetical protein
MEVGLLYSEDCRTGELPRARLWAAARHVGEATKALTNSTPGNPDRLDGRGSGATGDPGGRRDGCARPGHRTGLACRLCPSTRADQSRAAEQIQAVSDAA